MGCSCFLKILHINTLCRTSYEFAVRYPQLSVQLDRYYCHHRIGAGAHCALCAICPFSKVALRPTTLLLIVACVVTAQQFKKNGNLKVSCCRCETVITRLRTSSLLTHKGTGECAGATTSSTRIVHLPYHHPAFSPGTRTGGI